MITKSLSVILFLAFTSLLFTCHRPNNNRSQPLVVKKTGTSEKSYDFAGDIKKAKQHIDSLTKDTNQLIVLVKVPGSNKLLPVKGDNYPEEIETTYNLFKDKEGKIIYVVEVPQSESGDWFIDYKSYFNSSGKLIAFTREANFFNSECVAEDSEPAHETLTKYYTLNDNNSKALKKSLCVFNYNYPYKIIKTLDNYLKVNRLENYKNH
jgi:hypothetical protein